MATARPPNQRPFAIVTGASSGIGYYLAKECAENRFDLLIAAVKLRVAVHEVVAPNPSRPRTCQ